jgi:hypothetical protein
MKKDILPLPLSQKTISSYHFREGLLFKTNLLLRLKNKEKLRLRGLATVVRYEMAMRYV